MEKRTFGRTGLEVSRLVLGGGIVGGILILSDEATRLKALQRAVAAGIDWIDTASAYGDGASEETIGRHLPGLDPRPRISTKVRLKTEEYGDIPGAIERSLERSLRRLKLDSVTLFQLHNPVAAADSPRTIAIDRVLGPDGVADTMDRLQRQGLIGHAGFTALGEMPAVVRVIESGRFRSAQVYHNILNPSAAWERAPARWSAQDFSGIIPACRRSGVAVMNIRVLAGGSLASPEPHGREAIIATGSELGREAARAAAVRAVLGDAYGTPAQTALRFALGNPDIDCIVFGAAELSHLDEAITAAEQGPLPPEAVERVKPLWSSDFANS